MVQTNYILIQRLDLELVINLQESIQKVTWSTVNQKSSCTLTLISPNSWSTTSQEQIKA